MSDMTLFVLILGVVYLTARIARISSENARQKIDMINDQERQQKIDRLYGRD